MNTPTDTTEPTPKWEEIAPSLIELIHGDNDEAAQAAMRDVRRMAQLADHAVEMMKLIGAEKIKGV